MKKLIKKVYLLFLVLPAFNAAIAQIKWQNVDSLYGPLPETVHVYKTTSELDGKPNIAYYVIADLKDKDLLFTTDTTFKRRLTPNQFYQKNSQPLIVVNTTFFSFETNQNLTTVIKNKKVIGYNAPIAGRGKDTLLYTHPFKSALGITKKRTTDVAYVFADSSKKFAYASQSAVTALKDSLKNISVKEMMNKTKIINGHSSTSTPLFKKWKMQTAVGGGPVLLQNGEIKITNNEERMFGGKAINDRHPRTAMGYTADNKLIILVVEGRNPGIAEGASLIHEAQILKELGCVEALNLDGGGSSCLLINGKETIKPSDKGVQRAVPAVFMVKQKE